MTYDHPLFGVPMTETQYANEWEENSRYFSDNGHYKWMLEQLGGAEFVLEIGCGAGFSTLNLATAGKKIISIEVNQAASIAAKTRLEKNGISVELIQLKDLQHSISWGESQVKILCCDVFDEEVLKYIQRDSAEAIICWMIGSHPEHVASILDRAYKDFDGMEMAKFRIKVQTRCYELGRSTLKIGGVVHIVDRAAMMSWNDKDELRAVLVNRQNELAGNFYSISTPDTLFRKITSNFATSKIQYVAPKEARQATISALASSKASRTA